MSTHEQRQYNPEKERRLAQQEAQDQSESSESNEEAGKEAAKKLDEYRAQPEKFRSSEELPGQHVDDDYSGHLA